MPPALCPHYFFHEHRKKRDMPRYRTSSPNSSRPEMQSLNQHTQQAVTGIMNRKIVGGGEETMPVEFMLR
jgi:hypothetical protein